MERWIIELNTAHRRSALFPLTNAERAKIINASREALQPLMDELHDWVYETNLSIKMPYSTSSHDVLIEGSEGDLELLAFCQAVKSHRVAERWE